MSVVEKYPFVVPFEFKRLRDADTPVGIIMLPVIVQIPILGLESTGAAPLKVAVRLEGVSAAEDHTQKGKVATEWVKNWFAFWLEWQPEPVQLYLHTAGRLDNFGRWLGDIRTHPEHLSGLALDLLNSEYGEPYKRSLHEAW